MAGDVCEPAEPFVPNGPVWQNEDIPTDVNADGKTTALDALIIINEMDRRVWSNPDTQELRDAFYFELPTSNVHIPGFYYDVNDNGTVSAVDALNVINQIARDRVECGL